MSKVAVKISNKEVEINENVMHFIDDIVDGTMGLADVIVKDDISTNIRNNYYYSKKYISMPLTWSDFGRGKKNSIFNDMFDKVENIINETSTPREYASDVEIAKEYLKHVVNKYNNIRQNQDTWENDFKTLNDVSDTVMKAIIAVIYETSTDEYNKPSLAEDILDVINIGVAEAMKKANS